MLHILRPALRIAAPCSRQVRAAIAMDTIDMTFDPSSHPGHQLTEPLEALTARQ